MPEKVEIHEGYFWTCDSCGRDNFIRAVRVELTPEEIEEARKSVPPGCEPDGHFFTYPRTVTCPRCHNVFSTED